MWALGPVQKDSRQHPPSRVSAGPPPSPCGRGDVAGDSVSTRLGRRVESHSPRDLIDFHFWSPQSTRNQFITHLQHPKKAEKIQ